MMRQAGRYLPEYQEVRSRYSFLDLCRNAEAACEVTLQPIDRFGFDAAIIFSDILLPLIPMGAPFEFEKGVGPQLPEPFDTPEKIKRLERVDAKKDIPWVHEALAMTRSKLDSSKALLGFAGAPFTLFCYLVEGEGSRLFPKAKGMLFNDPETAHSLLGMLAEQVGEYLKAQVEAGADAVQLFDTWAGLLHPDDYAQYALPYARRVFEIAKEAGAPTIYYVNGGASLIDQQARAHSTAIGVDWRVRLKEIREWIPDEVVLQGNLDPLVLLAPPDEVTSRTCAMLREMHDRPGYIVNLGHGVIPQTPIASVEAFVRTVQDFETSQD